MDNDPAEYDKDEALEMFAAVGLEKGTDWSELAVGKTGLMKLVAAMDDGIIPRDTPTARLFQEDLRSRFALGKDEEDRLINRAIALYDGGETVYPDQCFVTYMPVPTDEDQTLLSRISPIVVLMGSTTQSRASHPEDPITELARFQVVQREPDLLQEHSLPD